MADNKQNLNQKIELNEYGVNFGAIINNNSVKSRDYIQDPDN